MTHKKLAKKSLLFLIIFSLLAPHLFFGVFVKPTHAAGFTQALMRLDRMTASQTDVDILVVIEPATAGTEDEIRIDFDAAFGVDATPSNITTSTTGITSIDIQGTTLTAMPSVGAAANAVSSQQVDITIGDLAVDGSVYGFFITAGIDSPAAGQHTHGISTLATNTEIDNSIVATRTIANDQVVVTGTVPPTFTFTLDQNTLAVGNSGGTPGLMDASSVNTSPDDVVVTLGTNASNGWITWLASANAGLDSVVSGETIDTAGSIDDACTAVSSGTDYYQLDVNGTDGTGGTGDVTVDSEYDCTDGTQGGTFNATLEPIATSDGTANDDTLTLDVAVAFEAIKAAATDYTDTWTIIGAANF